ncbi:MULTISPECIES: ABC transporter ATP-binding protein [Bradyrhizobium]|uniref:ABC transporter ATP-binding protein n=1 Tax=Bradyrhizobium TaxID=374 RepID=UPI0004873D6B|nr:MULTISPECIES: ABC transporter ATP-binding protein [Bradyrhizobium]MCS3447184.1 peptide/nickel transport system ATP-binding protein [Bradyrhizobium elkanii]MCS3561680.1 peptide/nickel transport system ATP-binding protein [Bradyrhizobium elkanii]MCW2148480.1 peptide/nickel transport system ATP-binding protein [Bradyrhizobium elkanii]MCW2352433.1 peptide/nickel transport system ATP-binding protein [Bradyrhizobium elkanii]MCW2372208.1 peptide/nickel transport system ATP-binding protein [Bradyrh
MDLSLILEVDDLTVGSATPGAAPILDHISFRLNASEIFGIYGESGAGKTVLSRALANWLPQSLAYRSGGVTFAGHDILGAGAREVRIGRDIAYIGSKPQSSLDPTVPVGTQIAEKLHSVRPEWNPHECRERVVQLLGEVRIPSPKERYWDYPAKFSGGMMQRAMIVDAICAEPAVLIADNITQPLDVTIAAQIVALLHDLCLRHRTATIYLSSSLPTLGQFGDRTAVLHQGRFVEQQAFADLLAAPQTDYTRKAIASVPRMWATTEGPPARRKAQDELPLMKVEHVVRTYRARKRGTFNTYSNVQAVRGVTLDIMPRENFGIVGESGCGKSTLTRLLAWLEVPDNGSIVLNGTSLGTLSPRELIRARNEFQLLLQDPYNALPPRTTVGRMIEESLLIRGNVARAELRSRVIAAMAEVGLAAELYDQLPNALSTGERQRISIARALILDPKLLILDETLSALDQREQSRLIDLFSKLQEKNDLTYVFISHDLAMVRRVCTRIAVMYLGEMVEIADNRELFFDPQHPYTKALLSAAPTLEEKPFNPADFLLEGEPPSPIDIPAGCSFASRCPKAFGRCRLETPNLVERAPGRLAACHLLDGEPAQAAA